MNAVTRSLPIFYNFWLFFAGFWVRLRWRAVALRLVFCPLAAIAELDLEMMNSFDRSRNGCRVQAVALAVLFGCFRVSAGNRGTACPGPGGPIAMVGGPQTTAFYVLCGVVLVVLILIVAAWTLHLRRQALRQRREDTEQAQALRALQEGHEISLRRERLTAVGQLSAGLAHEFNNIMTIVQGHASLLKENPNLDEQSTKSLAYIAESSERMAKLIRQMLAFSRKQAIQTQPLDVRETLGLTFDMLERTLNRQVALRFDIAPHLPPVMADWEMFQQILINLVANGSDAMGGGGQLTIRAYEANFSASDLAGKSERRAGQFVRLSVTDTGSGMDSAVLHHLFEPFFTTKEVGKGTGLGLAAVYGMVQQHQGWIEVESKPGQGTTFNVFFPATDQAPQKAEESASPPKARGGDQETVLVVEDESVLRELVREVLTAQGYGLLEAADGVAALDVWDEHRDKVDLLLTDIAMPRGVSGRDLAERLRKDAPRLPVIFSSGYSQEMVGRSDESVQGAIYLAKPYRPAQLAQAVRDALDAAGERGAPVAETVS